MNFFIKIQVTDNIINVTNDVSYLLLKEEVLRLHRRQLLLTEGVEAAVLEQPLVPRVLVPRLPRLGLLRPVEALERLVLQLRNLPLLRRSDLAQVRAESLHRLGVHLDAHLLLIGANVYGKCGRPCLEMDRWFHWFPNLFQQTVCMYLP